MITSSQQIIDKAKAIAEESDPKRIVVAAAQDSAVLSAVVDSVADGFVSVTLVGDETKIKELAGSNNLNIDGLDIIDEPDISLAAHKSVSLAAEGKADAIMKGFLPTSALLKVLLDKRYMLRGKNTLSHCAVLDIPNYHKLLNMTDGGMVIAPDLEQKFQILENSLLVSRALGINPVKIAVSGPSTEIPDDLDYLKQDQVELLPRARQSFDDIIIDAPVPFDVAVTSETAKGYERQSEIAGEADVFLVNSIEECNIIAKTMIQFIDAVFAGVIVGAKIPVSLVSRTDTKKNKMTSLALAAVVADYYQSENVFEGGK